MGLRLVVAIFGNFLLIAGLVVVGFRLFAQYHARGRWAKNISGLLAGCGMMLLAFALMITPRNAQVVSLIANTQAYMVFLIASNVLLLGAIAAYGVITYWRPGRLSLERTIEQDQQSGLPHVP